ncbi:MAG: hypothetical protein K0R73_739 [Candidatus Midichloriaceae bacterium]|jgi:beta-lactamase class D|nr:hypothetical protein [Candidatus Midichloriaceae bacterium]
MYKLLKTLMITTIMGLFSLSANASEACFIAKEDGRIVKQLGKCAKRHSPVSTFKIALAVIGFDAGILTSPKAPVIKVTPEIEKNYFIHYNPKKHPIMLFWKQAQTPQSWMHNSVIWYSLYITHQLGIEKFQEYVNKLNYGNKNVAGDHVKKDGLMASWIDGSLEISPLEQVQFIEKLANNTLPLSKTAQENTIKIIKMESIFDGWQLYGKTGGGIKMGWFVGWVEKDGRRIEFAQYVEQPENALLSSGRVAKEVAKDNLISLIIK